MMDSKNTRELRVKSTSDLPFTVEQLRIALDYDPETGIFKWKTRITNAIRVGDIAGTLSVRGYWYIRLYRVNVIAHRLAWMHVFGEWPSSELDHINGIRSDNRISNLKLSTRAGNTQNRKGVKGCSYRGDRNKWYAGITVNKRHICLGYFDDEHSARAAYLEAKRKHHSYTTDQ